MSTLSVHLMDPTATLVTNTAGTDGPLIDQIRDNCGFIIQAIDWVTRKLGFDLIGAIFDPIAGDYDAVDAMASNWGVMGSALGQIGDNFTALQDATPHVWKGEASVAAVTKLGDFAEGFATQSEAARLISTAMQDMLVATKAIVEFLADLLSMIDEIVISMTIAKIIKEIATMGGGIRKVVSLVGRAIETIKKLENVVPPLLQACAALEGMMKVLDSLFLVANVATNVNTGTRTDDLADHGF